MNTSNKIKPFELNNYNKDVKNPFVVPEDYFDKLPRQILDKCQNSKATTYYSIVKLSYLIPIAASLAIVILFAVVFQKTGFKKSLSSDEIAEVILNDDNLYGIDEDLIAETISTTVLTKQSENKTIIIKDSVNKIQISKEDIIDYLNDEDLNSDSSSNL